MNDVRPGFYTLAMACATVTRPTFDDALRVSSRGHMFHYAALASSITTIKHERHPAPSPPSSAVPRRMRNDYRIKQGLPKRVDVAPPPVRCLFHITRTLRKIFYLY
jgi:hypothetical protein